MCKSQTRKRPVKAALLLHLDRAEHCPVDAIEHDQQRVTSGLNEPSAMLVDRWVDQTVAQRLKPFQRSQVIPAQSGGCNRPCRRRPRRSALTISYLYDFGACFAGARALPPEDVGGVVP